MRIPLLCTALLAATLSACHAVRPEAPATAMAVVPAQATTGTLPRWAAYAMGMPKPKAMPR